MTHRFSIRALAFLALLSASLVAPAQAAKTLSYVDLVDRMKMGKPIDLFNRGVIRTDAIPLGTMELTRGEHVLGVEIVGKNENAVPSYMFGLDEVVLEKTT